MKEELSLSSGKVTNIDITDFYKVPFEKVIDLVRGRKVYLKTGIAYITHMDLSSVFLSYFRDNLIRGLEVCKCFPMCVFRLRRRITSRQFFFSYCLQSAKILYDNISDDERLTRYFTGLPSAFSGMARVVWSTTATPIDKLNDVFFLFSLQLSATRVVS